MRACMRVPPPGQVHDTDPWRTIPPVPYTLNPIGFFLLINLITSESLDPLQVWPYTLHPEP